MHSLCVRMSETIELDTYQKHKIYINYLNYFYLWPLAEVPTYRNVRWLSVARLFVARCRGQRFGFRANFFVWNIPFRSAIRLTHYFPFFHATPARLWTLKPNVIMTILYYLDMHRVSGLKNISFLLFGHTTAVIKIGPEKHYYNAWRCEMVQVRAIYEST